MSDNLDKPVEFKVMPNGPLHAKGKFSIMTPEGKTIEITDEAFFCRCGASKNKPFCDGSHRTSGANL
jgi:CDGSH-type Zn-finger protein